MLWRITNMIAVLGCLIFAHPAQAGITEIQPFRFGNYILKNNDAVHTVTVNPGGTYNFSSGFIEITPIAQPGIYDIDGLTPGATITSITVTQISPLSGPGGNNYQMSAFQTFHTDPDGDGIARVRLGATASTDGSGIPYMDQTYVGELEMTLNF